MTRTLRGHGSLFLIFLLVVMIQKVDWEWRLESPPGPAPPPQSTAIVLSPPATSAGFLRKVTRPETKPASPFDGPLEADLYLVTGYSVGDGHTPGEITADGRKVRPGITVACPPELELGTAVYIEGIGVRICEDRGSDIVDKRLDVAFETPQAALVFGKQWMRVAIIR